MPPASPAPPPAAPPPMPVDRFVDAVQRSGLLSAAQLAPYLPAAAADRLVGRLVADGLLTPFQGQQLLAGRAAGFFLAGKYKLLDRIGEGGIGRVYACEHLLLQRLVAVKVLQANAAGQSAGVTERFVREARAVARLDHPNVARVFDMELAGPAPFLVLEFVDGTDLHALVARHGPLPAARAAHYALQAARGLGEAHRAGLVHRDVKPGNLVLDRTGTVKLLDLGLARFYDDAARNDNLTADHDARRVIGTADFIAPEQTVDSSAVDIRADLYGLGYTLYYLLTGRLPFDGGSVTQKLLWHQLKEPPPVTEFRSDVPPGLLAALARLTAKDPARRPQTPAEAADLLAPFGPPVPPPAAAEMPPVPADGYRLGLTPAGVPKGDTALTLQALTAGEATGPQPTGGTRPPVTTGKTPTTVRRLAFLGTQLSLLAAGFLAAWLIQRVYRVEDKLPPARPPSTVKAADPLPEPEHEP